MSNQVFSEVRERLLPIHIIKRSVLSSLATAEFRYVDGPNICICLKSDEEKILIAKRQGDLVRTWRSADSAIEFLKTNFKVKSVTFDLVSD